MKGNDLISRAAAIQIAERYGCNNGFVLGHHSGAADCIASEIATLPAVDAVPVVKCWNCKHFIDMSGTSYPSYCYKHTTFDADGEFDNVFSVEPDKYCSWGERRDSE